MTRLLLKIHPLMLASLCIALISGCVQPLQTGPLPDGVSITPLKQLRGEGPIAWHPSGTMLSVGSNGLILVDLTSGSILRLDPADPGDLVWSPDGKRMAIAWPQGESTRLELRNNVGETLAEIVVSGALDRLLWSTESGLIIITTQLKIYSFGGDLTILLHRWDGQRPTDTEILHNVTIKPATAIGWQQGKFSGSRAVLSPTGDELLYLRLHDPPAFTGSFRLALRHLETGGERQLATLPLTTSQAQFLDDERVLVDTGVENSTELDIWENTQTRDWPFAGGPLAISPGGRYWLVGGHLLHEGSDILQIQDLDQALFSPDGNRLLLQSGGNWHILKGLVDAKKTIHDAGVMKKLRQLRNWRSRGLITPEEFHQQQQRMLQP